MIAFEGASERPGESRVVRRSRAAAIGIVVAVATAPACSAVLGVTDIVPAADGGSPSGAGGSGRDSGAPSVDGSASSDDGGGSPGTDGAAGSDDGGGGDDGGPSDEGGPDLAPLSCVTPGAGISDCGGGAESCCTSVAIPGGSFERTYASGATSGTDPASISDFRLDKYLVTVGRFRAFVAAVGQRGYLPMLGTGKHAYLNGGNGLVDTGKAGGGAPAYETGWDSAWNTYLAATASRGGFCSGSTQVPTWTADAGAGDDLPMNCVSWYEAQAFCIWDGGFLPTEDEWEYASGAATYNLYPWGAMDPGAGADYAIFNCQYSTADVDCALAPVGSATLGAGPWGNLDLAGEVWEWSADVFAPFVSPCADCANMTDATGMTDAGTAMRARHGGAFAAAVTALNVFRRTATNNAATGPTRSDRNGVRCARAPAN